MKPILYLLCGLPGSGKTSYATKLEGQGVARFTVDEEVFKRYGKKFDSELLSLYETEIKAEFKERVKKKLQEGASVALDYGFWKKAERDEYKKFAEQEEAIWKLFFFEKSSEILHQRVRERNTLEPDSSHIISEELLRRFESQIETPRGEGEEIIKM